MTKEEALELVRKFVKKENLLKHIIATGACMKELAIYLDKDQEKWELAGILHDLDYEETLGKPEFHGIRTVNILRDIGFEDGEILDAILSHSGKKKCESDMEKVLYAVDPATGFIVACVLMHPSKRLNGIDVDFLLRRFKEKRFAQGANREQIKSIEDIEIRLNEFLQICLKGMRRVSEELGL